MVLCLYIRSTLYTDLRMCVNCSMVHGWGFVVGGWGDDEGGQVTSQLITGGKNILRRRKLSLSLKLSNIFHHHPMHLSSIHVVQCILCDV